MKNNLKRKLRGLSVLLLTAVMISCNTGYINASGLELTSKSAILINADTGEVLYQKEPHTQRQIASLSKVMTGIIVIEEGNLDSQTYITAQSASIKGTSFKLNQGTLMSKRDLLHGLLYISGNDAGDALARASVVGYQGFIDKMNAKVNQLGLTGTRFFDPHGLGSYAVSGANDNYSTAYDLAIIMKHAMSKPEFVAIQKAGRATTSNAKFPVLESNNVYMKEYNGAIGAKTGYTANAGNCQMAVASRNGKTLISVVLNSPKGTRDKETYALMDYGFSMANSYGYIAPDTAGATTTNNTVTMPITTPPVTDSVIVDLLG